MNVSRNIVICSSTPEASERERVLAQQLQLPLVSMDSEDRRLADFYLLYADGALTLYQNTAKAPGGLSISFSDPQLLRRTSDRLKQQNLCKAVGLKGAQPLVVLDAMAGLGRDAWLLASGGATVTMLERSALVFALLEDGVRRGLERASSQAPVLQRMQLQHADFLHIAPALPVHDVVYLDPMFPATNKQARAKKAMYLLQSVLQEEACDEVQLLSEACRLARRRVVVKRAKLSPWLAQQQPDIEYKGSANRFDVYLCRPANASPR